MKRALFRYYGGKWRLAPWIVKHLPPHRVYIEPFCGAASVFFHKQPSYGEILNDLSGDIVNYFRVLQNKQLRNWLKEMLLLTPYSRIEYDLAYEAVTDPVENARRFLIRSLMGYHADSVNSSNSKSGFRNDCGRSWSLPVHNWRDYPQYLDTFAERLRDAIIEQKDAFYLLDKWGSKSDHLWYIDPPYPHATRTAANQHKYFFELSNDDHCRLVETLRNISGMVVLSGYPTDLYQPLESDGWTKVMRNLKNITFQSGERTECLWINPAAVNNMMDD